MSPACCCAARRIGRHLRTIIIRGRSSRRCLSYQGTRTHALTPSFVVRTLKTMEVHLPQQQEAQLNALAAQTGRRTDELVQEAVARLLAYNEWFEAQVQIGIDQVARGEFIEEEEMDARVERMLRT